MSSSDPGTACALPRAMIYCGASTPCAPGKKFFKARGANCPSQPSRLTFFQLPFRSAFYEPPVFSCSTLRKEQKEKLSRQLRQLGEKPLTSKRQHAEERIVPIALIVAQPSFCSSCSPGGELVNQWTDKCNGLVMEVATVGRGSNAFLPKR